MSKGAHLWLRSETKANERRSLLSPDICKQLLANGLNITVERCPMRIFNDNDYEAVGCNMVATGSWKHEAPATAYICGLKELPENDTFPLIHTHIYFAHCFKEQSGWQRVLGRFKSSSQETLGGALLDLEFLQDEKGFAGAAFGVDVWCQQQLGSIAEYKGMQPFQRDEALVNHIKGRLEKVVEKKQSLGDKAAIDDAIPKVMVMGALGRCGTGAMDFLKRCGIPSENVLAWDQTETRGGGPFPTIASDIDLYIHCIYLAAHIETPPFLTSSMVVSNPEAKLSVVVDVSCDYTNPRNPLPIYTQGTTFDKPCLSIETAPRDTPLSVVAIDHLPSLLPCEASQHFASALFPYFLALPVSPPNLTVMGEMEENTDQALPRRVWLRAMKIFQDKVSILKSDSSNN